MANNNHKSKELFPETNAFFRGLFTTTKPEPPKTVRELRRAISASGLRHADCVERSELEKRYSDAVIAARDAPAKDGLEIEQTLVRAGARDARGHRRPPLLVCGRGGAGISSRALPRLRRAHGVEFAALAALLCERLLPRRLQVVLPQCPSGESWFELDVTKYLYAVTMGEAAKASVVRRDARGRARAETKAAPLPRRRSGGGRASRRRNSASRASREGRAEINQCVGCRLARADICSLRRQGAMVAVDLALDASNTGPSRLLPRLIHVRRGLGAQAAR